jgi:hypothetical protein
LREDGSRIAKTVVDSEKELTIENSLKMFFP